MPKKENEKAVAARERKAAAKDSKSVAEAKAKEDAYWVRAARLRWRARMHALAALSTATRSAATARHHSSVKAAARKLACSQPHCRM